MVAARARVVGQIAGHWVKPKKIIGIMPRKLDSDWVLPSVSLSLKVRPRILSLRSLPYLYDSSPRVSQPATRPSPSTPMPAITLRRVNKTVIYYRLLQARPSAGLAGGLDVKAAQYTKVGSCAGLPSPGRMAGGQKRGQKR